MEVNKGEEFLSDENIARIKKIAQRELCVDGKIRPLLSEEEVIIYVCDAALLTKRS